MQEKVSDSSSKPPVHMAGRPNVPPYPLPVLPMDDDEISAKGKSDLLWADWFGRLCSTDTDTCIGIGPIRIRGYVIF